MPEVQLPSLSAPPPLPMFLNGWATSVALKFPRINERARQILVDIFISRRAFV